MKKPIAPIKSVFYMFMRIYFELVNQIIMLGGRSELIMTQCCRLCGPFSKRPHYALQPFCRSVHAVPDPNT